MIFDLIGVADLFIVQIKLVLHGICVKGINSNQKLPNDLTEEWLAWYSEIERLKEIRIRRNCLLGHINGIGTVIELHIFWDASAIAYGAVFNFSISG